MRRFVASVAIVASLLGCALAQAGSREALRITADRGPAGVTGSRPTPVPGLLRLFRMLGVGLPLPSLPGGTASLNGLSDDPDPTSATGSDNKNSEGRPETHPQDDQAGENGNAESMRFAGGS